jgi:hypothetical protein
MKARRVKRQFDYENVDEPIIDPKINFKVNLFDNIFNIAINSVNDRFEQIKDKAIIFFSL